MIREDFHTEMGKIVMALGPHPDDAEYYAGGLLARFAQEGARVILVVATDGRCGSYDHEPEDLARLRADEARQAARVLGTDELILLGYPDFGLDRLPPGQLREQFIRLIRQYRPDITVCEDAFYLQDTHPDHRVVAWAASDAIQYAGLPLVHPEHRAEGLEPHFVTEKYYYAEGRLGADRIVDITGTLELKLAAMAQHQSQIKFLVEGIYRQAKQAGLALPPDLKDPLTAFAFALRTEAESVGRQGGFIYGEAYRYVRYHPIVEAFLAEQVSEKQV